MKAAGERGSRSRNAKRRFDIGGIWDGQALRRIDASAAGKEAAFSAVIAPGIKAAWVVGPSGIWRVVPVRSRGSETFINIHHYFMDTVIWRRENPDTRYLRGPA